MLAGRVCFVKYNNVILTLISSLGTGIKKGFNKPIRVKPQSAIMPLINYFASFPLLPIHLSLACRHLACLILLMQHVLRLREKDKQYALQCTKRVQTLMNRLGLKQLCSPLFLLHVALKSPSKQHFRFCSKLFLLLDIQHGVNDRDGNA